MPESSDVALIGGKSGSSLVKVRTLLLKSTSEPSTPTGDTRVISMSYIVGTPTFGRVMFWDSSPTTKVLFISYHPSESTSTL